MSEEISSALSLLLTGMVTVFVVLSLVVATGRLLIRISNRFYVEPTSPVSGRKLAAITAAVEVVTEGKGTITKIEQIKTK
jgi:oxaloacetate decarboxylase gamma subunit